MMYGQGSLLDAPADQKNLNLYDFQEEGYDGLRELFLQGYKSPMLTMPTGSGKTETSIAMMNMTRKKGKRAAFVAANKELVWQTAERLTKYGIPHGMVQANNIYGRGEKIQVLSAQTLERRDFFPGDLDIVFVDEAHEIRVALMAALEKWGGRYVGLSATPLTPGLADFYDSIINPTTTLKLLERKLLVPLRMYAAKEMILPSVSREWTDEEIRKASGAIYGDVVREWVEKTNLHFGGPVPTLVFSADIAHGRELCRRFQEAGYDFRQGYANMDETANKELVKGFKNRQFIGLVSVSKYTKGFDDVGVKMLVDVRANKTSLAAVIQKWGRGMRQDPDGGKDYCVLNDHTGNIAGWYDAVETVWMNGVAEMLSRKDDKGAQRKDEKRKDSECASCGSILPPLAPYCPGCGRERSKERARSIGHSTASKGERPGHLEEVTAPGSRGWLKDRDWCWRQFCLIGMERRKGDRQAARKFAAGQWKDCYGAWPSGAKLLDAPPDVEIDERVRRKVKSNIIRWMKGRNKE